MQNPTDHSAIQNMNDDDFYFSAFEQSPEPIPPTPAELTILDHWDHNLLPDELRAETETEVLSVLARHNRISLNNLTEFPLTPQTEQELLRLFYFIYPPNQHTKLLPDLMANLLMNVFFRDYFNPPIYPDNTDEIPF